MKTEAKAVFDEKIPDIDGVFKNFDLRKINLSKNSQNGLTLSYGDLDKESIKTLDDDLKVMIAATMKLLGKIKEKNYDTVLASLMQSQFLEQHGPAIRSADRLPKRGTSYFQLGGGPDSAFIREFQSWFANLVQDKDILQRTPIDMGALAHNIGQTGVTVDSLTTLLSKTQRIKSTIFDVSVLSLPDTNQPFFKLYHISLVAWSDSQWKLCIGRDSDEITGDFVCRTFGPRKQIIKGMSLDARSKAIAMAEALFDQEATLAHRDAHFSNTCGADTYTSTLMYLKNPKKDTQLV